MVAARADVRFGRWLLDETGERDTRELAAHADYLTGPDNTGIIPSLWWRARNHNLAATT
jgi:hypothetical protein